jgi:hypothetical protein
MRKIAPILSTLTILVFTAAFSAHLVTQRTSEPLAIGAAAPLTNQSLVTTDGAKVTLESAKGDKGLLVIFSCNTCPWVEKWEDRYHTVAAAAGANGITTLLLNSNEALREGDESLAAMKARSAAMGYTFPYAVDPGAVMADAFGANRTPEVFLFDAGLTLIYHGAIDDNARDVAEVEAHFLMDAIASYAGGTTIEPNTTKSIGCTIKRKR